MKPLSHEDRGDNLEEIIKRLPFISHTQKELVMEYLQKVTDHDNLTKKERTHKTISTISSLEQLILRYPNVDFAGFMSRDNDKEHYQLWKLIDAFDETTKRIGRRAFQKLKITLIVFGNKITYISNGTIAVNYERFSEKDLVKQLVSMARQQGV